MLDELDPAADAAISLLDFDLQQAEESRQLAAALHDGPVQQLTAVVMQLEIALRLAERDTSASAAAVRRAAEDTRDVVAQLRDLIFDLRLGSVAEAGLPVALREYVADLATACGWTVHDAIQPLPELSLPLSQTLFLIAREALQNARVHARADAVSLSLGARDGRALLQIRDHGVGFDPARVAAGSSRERHFGLQAMRDRTARAGGTIEIQSQPGAGTCVTVTVPLVAPGRESS